MNRCDSEAAFLALGAKVGETAAAANGSLRITGIRRRPAR